MVLSRNHGPIVAQKKIEILRWPTYEEFEEMMAITGAHVLAEILPGWIEGKLIAIDQKHANATYTKKIKKEDGLIDLNDDPYTDKFVLSYLNTKYKEWIKLPATTKLLVNAQYRREKIELRKKIK